MKVNEGTVCIGTIEKHEHEEIRCNDYYKQFMASHTLCLPEHKPDIESILELIVESKIIRYKIINTPHGKKIVFHGVIRIKITYVAENTQQSVHSAHTSKHFYNFINIGENDSCDTDNLCKDLCKKVKINSYIEDIEPDLIDKRKIEFTALVLITIKLCKGCIDPR